MSNAHIPVFTCPKCGCHDVATIELRELTSTYYDTEVGFETGPYYTTNRPDILTSAQCNDCEYELTNDELAAIEKSIAGLVIGARPYPSPDKDVVREKLCHLAGNQARIALAAIAEGISFMDAVKIGESYLPTMGGMK